MNVMPRPRYVYVYRLLIQYPEGSDQPGWQPAAWSQLARTGRWWSYVLPKRPARFRWPRERMWLSSSAAYHRAYLLRVLGCSVTVQRSVPVVFDEQPHTGSGGPLPLPGKISAESFVQV